MISTKGRYSVRILLDLAENATGSFIPLKEVAARQGISLKYIEKILPALKNSGLIESVHGTGGGYRLNKDPQDITLLQILTVAEGSLAPVACLQAGAPACERAANCKTLDVWKDYYELTKGFFDDITLADLMEHEPEDDIAF